jgi:hypothetical protein
LFQKPLYEKRNIIAHLFDTKEDHIAGRQVIVERLQVWKLLLRTQHMSATQKVAIYDTITEVEQLLGQNVHPRAVMDILLLAIP